MKLFTLLAIGLFLCSVTACGSDDPSTEEQACLDTADAFEQAATRCGADGPANRKAFIQTAANGDCANIVSVRDETALRNTCLPSLKTITCADLVAANLDASCRAQLQHL